MRAPQATRCGNTQAPTSGWLATLLFESVRDSRSHRWSTPLRTAQFSVSGYLCSASATRWETKRKVSAVVKSGEDNAFKLNSRKYNAFKHGAFARYAVLHNESEEEFWELNANLFEELRPEGALEQETVSSIAKLIWAKRRTEKMFNHELESAQESPYFPIAAIIRKMQQDVDLAKTRKELDKYIGVMREPFLSNIRQKIGDANDLDFPAYLERVKAALRSTRHWIALEMAAQTSDPIYSGIRAETGQEVNVKYLAALERIDAMIDRAFKRLFQLKGFKEIVTSRDRTQIGSKERSVSST